MKILLINQAFYPDTVATSRHLTEIALYLQQAGHQVSVYSSRCNYERPKEKYKAFENYQGIKIYRLPVTGLGKRNFFTRICDAILFQLGLVTRLLWDRKPDVVVSLTTPPLLGFTVVLCSILKRVRCVQYIMDMHPHTAVELGYLKKNSLLTRILYSIFTFTMRHSERVVVLDRWMGEKVAAHGVERGRIKVVPLWPTVLMTDNFEQRTKNPFRMAHQLGDKFVILYSGNHGIAHPLDTVLEAANRLKDDPNFVFLFVGAGERVKDVSLAVEKHGLTNVIQLPFQPNQRLQQMLSAADVHLVVMGDKVSGLIHPSKIYGVLAVGKPYIFVGPKESAVCDLIAECPGGWHLSHGDVDGFVSNLKNLRSMSQENLAEVGAKNSAYVQKHFTSDSVIRRFAETLA